MENIKKKYLKLIHFISRVFWPGLFFLTHYVYTMCKRSTKQIKSGKFSFNAKKKNQPSTYIYYTYTFMEIYL